ncbi:MAG: hypothetical protein F6K56_41700 [Moorea sp. SIO3G5]|nr:hypothetical protein [Moorena sp. SIO3G5]
MTTPNRPSSGAKASRLSQPNINDYDWQDYRSMTYTSYTSFRKSPNLKISQRNLPHWELAGAIYQKIWV